MVHKRIKTEWYVVDGGHLHPVLGRTLLPAGHLFTQLNKGMEGLDSDYSDEAVMLMLASS